MEPTSAANDLAERIDRLEIRVAYQDQVIEDLNRTVTAQWAQIESLTRELKRLTDRLQQVEERPAADVGDEPPPPHY